ncbi:MAG: serine--tRNA ligase [bacterium]|nr:MAG: serine--tRNA ligase [bacterium]
MLDLKLFRKEREKVIKALARRHVDVDFNTLFALEERLRAELSELEKMRREMNGASAEIGRLVREKKDASYAKVAMKQLSTNIDVVEASVKDFKARFSEAALVIPNIPDESVPDGESEADNKVVRTWGEPPVFDFEPKTHVELGETLGILDFKRAAKMSGARFVLYRGTGARLERSLISFMLNVHTAGGYEEVLPPFMVNRKSMTGTGQLPKFEEDLFKVEGGDYYLIPTAEVPITNIYADEIIDDVQKLPVRMCAYTPCFRREAGSYGKDTAGIIRQHQFNKVELVKLAKPEDSTAELESLTADAESILQKLDLPYRVVELCAGDLGFAAAKTYDIEVWIPSQKKYREISSCSSFTDFQARRAGIRFKRDKKAKPELVHTLNGSGLAIGRTVVAILENFQRADGSVSIPEPLRRYMNDREFL